LIAVDLVKVFFDFVVSDSIDSKVQRWGAIDIIALRKKT
jgi:hypothetical protein